MLGHRVGPRLVGGRREDERAAAVLRLAEVLDQVLPVGEVGGGHAARGRELALEARAASGEEEEGQAEETERIPAEHREHALEQGVRAHQRVVEIHAEGQRVGRRRGGRGGRLGLGHASGRSVRRPAPIARLPLPCAPYCGRGFSWTESRFSPPCRPEIAALRYPFRRATSL